MSPRKKGRRPVTMVGKFKLGEDTRWFDMEFWRRVGAEGRFRAMCELVASGAFWQDGDGSVPRLRRDVASVVHRESTLHDQAGRRA
jgi:hypothetical protein